MSFISFEFFSFFLFLFIAKSFVVDNTLYKYLLLAASLLFYATAGWSNILLFSVSIILNYALYVTFNKAYISRRIFLNLILIFNLGLLLYYKYSSFLANEVLGYSFEFDVMLPLGISFFTFQQISFAIDSSREKKRISFSDYSLYVAFFPQLVAGPIVRSTELLPQFLKKPKIEMVSILISLRYLAYGFFKKVIVADSLSLYTSSVFVNYESYSGGDLLLNLIYYSAVIYCDFSGYTDMAIGLAGLLGYSLPRNFNFPYFSKNIHEFWNRWHITLSSWFKEYVYFPLGGSRNGLFITNRNIAVVFILSGLWHGAAFGFLLWGIIHVLYYFIYRLYSAYVKFDLPVLIGIGLTYFLVTIAWVPFSLENANDTLEYLLRMFTDISIPVSNRFGVVYLIVLFFFELIFYQTGGEPFNLKSIFLRWFLYLTLGLLALRLFVSTGDFVYFRF